MCDIVNNFGGKNNRTMTCGRLSKVHELTWFEARNESAHSVICGTAPKGRHLSASVYLARVCQAVAKINDCAVLKRHQKQQARQRAAFVQGGGKEDAFVGTPEPPTRHELLTPAYEKHLNCVPGQLKLNAAATQGARSQRSSTVKRHARRRGKCQVAEARKRKEKREKAAYPKKGEGPRYMGGGHEMHNQNPGATSCARQTGGRSGNGHRANGKAFSISEMKEALDKAAEAHGCGPAMFEGLGSKSRKGTHKLYLWNTSNKAGKALETLLTEALARTSAGNVAAASADGTGEGEGGRGDEEDESENV